MASAFTHAFSALALGTLFQEARTRKGLLLTGMLSAALPDLDVIAFPLGIPYEHPLGHRGLTHSLFFAMLWALAASLPFRRSGQAWRVWIYLFICTASHGFLDALTTGGRGVGFFIPFDNSRYFFPWRFIRVSPIHASAFFTERGLAILSNEIVTVWLPMIVVSGVAWMVRKTLKRGGTGTV